MNIDAINTIKISERSFLNIKDNARSYNRMENVNGLLTIDLGYFRLNYIEICQ